MARRRSGRQRKPPHLVAPAGGDAAAPAATLGPRGAALIVALAAVVAFGGSLRNQFTYDEGLVIGEADGFLRSGSLGPLFSPRYFAASREGTYRPAVTFSYMIDRAFSPEPIVFKAQSLLWHVGCSLLVLLLAGRILPAEQRRFALFAALLFAVHPLGTETVDNASFREDALVTFFTVAALLLALSDRLVAALVCYAVALLSKESAVVLPALLLGARVLALGSATRALRAAILREAAALTAVTIIYLIIRFGPMNTPGAYASFAGGTRGATLLGMPAVFAHYLRLLVLPWPLCADYSGYFDFGPRSLISRLPSFLLLAAFVFLLVTALRSGRRAVAFGLGWFVVALLPVANIIAVPVPAAERFLYLPLVGLSVAVAAAAALLVARWPRARQPLLVAAIAIGVVFVLITNVRHLDWHDNDRLWAVTARENPRSCGAQSAVGGARLREGLATHARSTLMEGAEREELALRLCPPNAADPVRGAMILTRLGAARAVLGQLDPARQALEQAVALSPRYALGVVWMGYVQFLGGDKRGAELSLRHAVIDLGPPDASVAQVASQYMDKL